MAKRNATWRVWAVVGAIAIGLIVIVARLVQLQIIDHDQYRQQASNTHLREQTLYDQRAAILDRNGYPLAASEYTFDVYVEIGAWEDPTAAEEAAREVAKITSTGERGTNPDLYLICIEIRRFKGPSRPRFAPVRRVHTTNQFGREILDAVAEKEGCYPAEKSEEFSNVK